MKKNITVEVCANSVESALAAQSGGAHRVELCSSLSEGGITPSYASIEIARKRLSIRLNVLIRPRGGDFLYTDLEFELMKRDIEVCKNLGVDGVVIGILDENGNIDTTRTMDLIRIARPMSVTFHRAFDMANDPFVALSDLIRLGVDRLLTSGQKDKVTDNLPLIKKLVDLSGGSVSIMPGGGISSQNIQNIILSTNVLECHMTGKKDIPSRMKYKNPEVSMGDNHELPEYATSVTDAEEIRRIVSLVSN
jgi:copper homeostasis protein